MEFTGFSEINTERLKFKGPGFWYCEVALTGQCNFNCKYCNRFRAEVDPYIFGKFIYQYKDTLRHVQITGGEPTLYPSIFSVVDFIKNKGIRCGLSTNGSAPLSFYKLLKADMYSISLDDYDFNILEGRGYKDPSLIVDNIKELSKSNYVNVGLVVDSLNYNRLEEIIDFILSLGVSDIKISINTKDEITPIFSDRDYSKYPILDYRIKRFRKSLPMRGIPKGDNFKCELSKNDISIIGDEHYPCLVYAREGGKPIGTLNNNVYNDRLSWYNNHVPQKDNICKKYCMDFKCEFNRSVIK